MSATKLTLRLEESLIEEAKEFARSSGKSLSQVVADYFRALTRPTNPVSEDIPTPITDRLAGRLRGSGLSIEDYRQHLVEKYR